MACDLLSLREAGHHRAQCLCYKVRLCMKYEEGLCRTPDCPYAHGQSELRQPWKARCVRVVKQNGQFICIGCNSSEHTFRKCPLQKNFVLI